MSGLRFLPWVRAGLSAGFPSAASLPARGQVTVTAVLGADGAGVTVPGEIATFGPGDVLGLDGEQVIRRFPAPDTDGAETTGFACVELDNPDAPWAFTTGGPDGDGRLRPWLVLVVVPAPPAECWRARPTTPCPSSPARRASCPTSRSRGPGRTRSSPSPTTPRRRRPPSRRPSARCRASSRRDASSRAPTTWRPSCPPSSRVASPDSGLPLDEHETGDLADAWDHTSGEPVDLPVYDTWRFSTGVGRRLRDARASHRAAGGPRDRRPARDVRRGGRPRAARRGRGRPGRGARPRGRPASTHIAAHGVARTGAVGSPLPRCVACSGTPSGSRHRSTGQGTRAPTGCRPTASGPEWLRELNLDPRHRVAAGLGARVVRDHQEELAEAAWSQAASLRQANDLLRRAQLARAVSEQLHQRRLTEEGPGRPLSQAEVLALTAPVSRFVPLTPRSGQSVGALVDANPGLAAVSSPAFRRVGPAARPRGPARRCGRADPAGVRAWPRPPSPRPRRSTRPRARCSSPRWPRSPSRSPSRR